MVYEDFTEFLILLKPVQAKLNLTDTAIYFGYELWTDL